MEETARKIYLMRGLPACGKSHKARRLAGQTGVVLETDQYFYTQVGQDDSTYDYSDELLPAAREWNLQRFRAMIAETRSPIVVDRGNGLNQETFDYASYGHAHGYELELAEPDSPWWRELRVLLKYKEYVAGELFDYWASQLANATRDGHRVPSAKIRRWMSHWKYDLTVLDILDFSD